jgi:MscS family membrane protein
MDAVRDEKADVASQYLNSNLTGAARAELTNKLYVVLNSRLPVHMNVLSERPEGSLSNPLTPDRDVLGTIQTSTGAVDIAVERVKVGTSRVWLISRSTLEAVPGIYSEVDLLRFDQYLPGFLTVRIAGIRLVQWLTLGVIIPLLYRLLGAFDWLIRLCVICWRRLRGIPTGPVSARIPGSVRLLLLALAVHEITPSFDLPYAERRLLAVVAGLLAIAGVVWSVLLINEYAERYVLRGVRVANLGESRALVRLARRLADVVAFAAGGVIVLYYFGFDPTAALAGLGIGGIAVALAAQKTLENVIGGFSIVFDKAVRVGDFLKLGDTLGTVDRVGLRSTRIRTLDRSVVSIPNGQIATANIETLSDRDKFWFHHFVGVSYGTTAAQMRAVSEGVRGLLRTHERVEADSIQVQFFRLGPSSLDIEVFAYVRADEWRIFLAIQDELLLRILEIVEAAGTEVALPTRTVHVRGEEQQAWHRRPATTVEVVPRIVALEGHETARES